MQDKYNIQSDIHNLPMHLKCDVCNIPYKIVGKQETEKQVGIVATYLDYFRTLEFRKPCKATVSELKNLV